MYDHIKRYMGKNSLEKLEVILLFDEVKISAGISWNSLRHEIQGFCENKIDYASLLSK
jgi:hypothetical protein